jgi:hypothetical protein
LGRDFIFRANIFLLYSAFYYCPPFLGRDISVVLASSPLLPSGYDFIFRANTSLLYSVLYYYPFFSGRDLLVALASRLLSRVTSVLLLLVANLFLRAAFYYGLVFQPLLVAIVIPAVRIYFTSTKRLK